MTNLGKISVVVALIAAVGVVFSLKPRPAAPAEIAASAESQPVPLPRLLELGADKCIPCKQMAPILDDLKTTYAGQLEVDFIDVWKNPDAGDRYGIRVIPTQIFYDAQGNELFRHEGFFGKEDMLAKWQELGVDLQPQAAP